MDQLRAEAWLHKTQDLNLIPGGSASHEFDADGCTHTCVFGQWHMLLNQNNERNKLNCSCDKSRPFGSLVRTLSSGDLLYQVPANSFVTLVNITNMGLVPETSLFATSIPWFTDIALSQCFPPSVSLQKVVW